MRDGILIGVLLDHYGEIVIVGPSASRPAVFDLRFTVIYPVVKVRRRSGSASWLAPLAPTVRWSVGSWWSARIRGPAWIPTRVDGSEDLPANRRSWCGIRSLGMGPRDLLVSDRVGCAKSGGDEETRTPDPLLAKEMLCQLSYVPVTSAPHEVVGAPGLEPGTSALSGPRSNQLSYAPWMPGPKTRQCGRTITLEEW